MEWKTCAWSELDRDALYGVLQLRSEVFVVEQDCVYQDLDGKDEAGWHVVGVEAGVCVATARVLPPGVSYAEPSIGRDHDIAIERQIVSDVKPRDVGGGREIAVERRAATTLWRNEIPRSTRCDPARARREAQTRACHLHRRNLAHD